MRELRYQSKSNAVHLELKHLEEKAKQTKREREIKNGNRERGRTLFKATGTTLEPWRAWGSISVTWLRRASASSLLKQKRKSPRPRETPRKQREFPLSAPRLPSGSRRSSSCFFLECREEDRNFKAFVGKESTIVFFFLKILINFNLYILHHPINLVSKCRKNYVLKLTMKIYISRN